MMKSIYNFGGYATRSHIWSDAPDKETWRYLRYLASRANAANLLQGTIASHRQIRYDSNEVACRKAAEIAACICQADQYFCAADTVGLATQPLLQFYGVQSLAKATIVANLRDVWLRDLKYHGLTMRTRGTIGSLSEPSTFEAEDGAWCLEDEQAIVKGGVFGKLCESCGEAVVANARLRFKDLARMIPDIADLYRRHYGENGHALYLYHSPNEHEPHLFAFGGSLTKADILSVFPELEEGYSYRELHKQPGFESESEIAPNKCPAFAGPVPGALGGTFLVRRHASGVCNSTPVLYAISFMLSNIVRYKPVLWTSLLDGHSSGGVAVAEALVACVRRRFPREVLQALWGEQFTMGAPAYLL